MANNGKKTIEDMAEEKVFEGATIELGDLQRQDGLIAEAIDKAQSRNLGVIQTVITAEQDDNNYRQILKRGVWKSTHEMDLAVAALAECEKTNAKQGKKVILDRITARSAGLNGQLISQALEALTHTHFITNSDNQRRRHYDGSTNPASPLSK